VGRRLNNKKQKENLNHKAMKTLAKNLFAAALVAVVLTSSAMTTFATEPTPIVSKAIKAAGVDRIWVSGNVKILLTQGDKEGIVAADNYDASKTSVVTNGKTLYVNSMEGNVVTLNITVKDLQRVETYGDAEVVTSNNFDVKILQLFLHHNAAAKIKTTTKSLYTVVKDDATLKLKGTADQSTMVTNSMKNVKMGDFASLNAESYSSEAIMNARQTAMNASK